MVTVEAGDSTVEAFSDPLMVAVAGAFAYADDVAFGGTSDPIIGAFMMDTFNSLIGMMMSIVAWIFLPFFWIPVLRNILPEMEATEKVFAERLKDLKTKEQ